MEINVDGFKIDLLLGSDPEVFAQDSTGLISAYDLIPGNKETPHRVNKGAIQVDGMALEFNIDPAYTMEDFVNNINTVMGELQLSVPAGVSLAIIPTAEFGLDYIKKQPPIAQELGCSADYNAYTGVENVKPNAESPFRTAAGHIHIGWTQEAGGEAHHQVCCELSQVLDLYLGVPSVLVDPDVKRRSLYGAAGAFRPKTYGVEYRVLSNFWLKTDSYKEWVYKQTHKAVEAFMKGFRIEDTAKLQQVINTSDTKSALAMSYEFNLEVPHV